MRRCLIWLVLAIVTLARPAWQAWRWELARRLGLPASRGQARDPLLDRLYGEMWPALQAFAEHAEIDAAAGGR